MDTRRRRPHDRRPPEGGRDWIRLGGMSFRCVVGLEAAERGRPQPVDVEVALRVDLDPASGGDLGASVDYGTLVSEVELIVVASQFRLLESLAAALARHLLAPAAPPDRRGEVQAVRVRVAKPEIFAGQAVPSVEIERDRDWSRARQPARASRRGPRRGRVDCLQAADDRAAYHVTLEPGAAWALPAGGVAQVLYGAVQAKHERLTRGARPAPCGVLLADATQGARLLLVGSAGLL
jgi:FolB domain-containing protein